MPAAVVPTVDTTLVQVAQQKTDVHSQAARVRVIVYGTGAAGMLGAAALRAVGDAAA